MAPNTMAPNTMAPRTVLVLTKSLSPLYLNNKGVLLIEAERFAEAAACFKKASTIMMSVVATPQNQAREAKKSRVGSSPESSLSMQKNSTTKTTANDERSPISNGVPSWNLAAELRCDQPSRKRKAQSEEMPTPFVLPSYSLGRPLWIQSRGQRPGQKHLDMISLSATLLYNLGLCFHMIAPRKTTMHEAKPVYRRALEFYKISSDLIPHGSLANSIASPVFVVTLHNMVQGYTMLEEHELATKYRGQLAQVLRLMLGAASAQEEQGNHDIRYEEFYMRFLSLPNDKNVMAVAA
jgi:hypothetical protein